MSEGPSISLEQSSEERGGGMLWCSDTGISAASSNWKRRY